jgi:hypothetical protein
MKTMPSLAFSFHKWYFIVTNHSFLLCQSWLNSDQLQPGTAKASWNRSITNCSLPLEIYPSLHAMCLCSPVKVLWLCDERCPSLYTTRVPLLFLKWCFLLIHSLLSLHVTHHTGCFKTECFPRTSMGKVFGVWNTLYTTLCVHILINF